MAVWECQTCALTTLCAECNVNILTCCSCVGIRFVGTLSVVNGIVALHVGRCGVTAATARVFRLASVVPAVVATSATIADHKEVFVERTASFAKNVVNLESAPNKRHSSVLIVWMAISNASNAPRLFASSPSECRSKATKCGECNETLCVDCGSFEYG